MPLEYKKLWTPPRIQKFMSLKVTPLQYAVIELPTWKLPFLISSKLGVCLVATISLSMVFYLISFSE